jgi:hypothetical protein
MWYNQPELLVGEHELHLGNVMCGGHRRHKYRSIDKTKKNKWSHSHYMCITTVYFIHACRALAMKNKVSCLWYTSVET